MRRPVKRSLGALIAILILLLGLLAYTFVPRKLDVSAYSADANDFGFSRRAEPSTLPDVSLSIIKAGKMISKEAFIYRGGSWSKTYESGMAAVLIRHPKGTFLFDAGFGTSVDEHVKTIPWLMRKVTTYDKERSVAAQLEEHGVSRDQIKMIVLSHSHWDHVSGVEDFPEAVAWLPEAEIDYTRQLSKTELINQMAGKIKLHAIELTGGRYENFDRSLDLFDDGSVVLVPLPGHTPGSVGMFVNLRSGKRFFFVGDLTWSLEGLQLPAERPWISRKLVDNQEEEVRRSIVRVHLLMNRYPDLIVVPAHDRRVHDRIANFPDTER